MDQKARLHPLVGIAAASVTVFSLVGIAAVTGLLPYSAANRTDAAPAAASPAAQELVQAAATNPEQVPAAPPPAAARPAAHKVLARKPAPVKVAQAAPVQAAPVQVPAAAPAAIEPPPPPPAPVAAAPKPACADCGVVENFRAVEVKGDGSALGAIAGGAGGAVIGHQFGRGSGRDLLTIAGAIGGAFAGHEIEKNVRKKTRYEISVRMEDGSLRSVSQDSAPAWRIGDHVRVVNNQVVASS